MSDLILAPRAKNRVPYGIYHAATKLTTVFKASSGWDPLENDRAVELEQKSFDEEQGGQMDQSTWNSDAANQTQEMLTRVLIIDDDRQVYEVLRRILGDAGFDVTGAGSGVAGLAASRHCCFAAIVLDLNLPDIGGLEVLHRLRAEGTTAKVVVVSGCLTVPLAVAAIQSGATDVLEKPITRDSLVSSVRAAAVAYHELAARARRALPVRVSSAHGPSIAHRWATYVVKACCAAGDLRTLRDWAKHAGASDTTLSESCRLLGIKPHDARDLSRAVRAIIHSAQTSCPPAALLDIADSRTLRAFLQRAGRWFQPTTDIDAIDQFLRTQQFVAPHNPGLAVLRNLLRDFLSSGISTL